MKTKPPNSQADVRANRVEVATHIRGLTNALKQIQREEEIHPVRREQGGGTADTRTKKENQDHDD